MMESVEKCNSIWTFSLHLSLSLFLSLAGLEEWLFVSTHTFMPPR